MLDIECEDLEILRKQKSNLENNNSDLIKKLFLAKNEITSLKDELNKSNDKFMKLNSQLK